GCSRSSPRSPTILAKTLLPKRWEARATVTSLLTSDMPCSMGSAGSVRARMLATSTSPSPASSAKRRSWPGSPNSWGARVRGRGNVSSLRGEEEHDRADAKHEPASDETRYFEGAHETPRSAIGELRELELLGDRHRGPQG